MRATPPHGSGYSCNNAVERLLGHADLAADVPDRYPSPGLLQHAGDLLDGKALSSSRHTLLADRPDCAARLTLAMV